MKLIFAQGNPGSDYAATRHNIGWIVLEHLAKQYSASFQLKDKFKAEIAELNRGGEKVLLVRPQTFYNETGTSARLLIDFYKLDPAQDLLVIHDELALPFGTLRTREKGSDAGNNGIKSLNSHVGEDYKRLRIGIWNEHRETRDDADFVLSPFDSTEREQLPEIMKKTHRVIDEFIAGSFSPATL